jgi:hypothetical protein
MNTVLYVSKMTRIDGFDSVLFFAAPSLLKNSQAALLPYLLVLSTKNIMSLLRSCLLHCHHHHHHHHHQQLRVWAAKSSIMTTSRSLSSSFSSSSSSLDKNNNKKTTSKNASSVVMEEPQHFERTVYVHPLSQIVLEHFQERRHDWIVERGLDRALTVHRDGSFELNLNTNHDSNAGTDTDIGTDTGIGTDTANDDTANEHHHRIWTSYDEKEKKHWLTVHKAPSLHGRFLLQDNLSPAWHDSRKSLPERIHAAVDEMISVIENK